MGWIYLTLAIISEVIGTLALTASDGFSKAMPSVICVIGYGVAFYFLSQVLKVLPVGIVYAIWSGVGVVLITAVAAVWFKQIPDLPAIVGITFIIAGVAIIHLFSTSMTH